MQVFPRNTRTVKDFTWRMLKIILQQHSTIFFACDSYKDSNIKNVEKIGRGLGLRHLLKSPDLIIPSEFSIFSNNVHLC